MANTCLLIDFENVQPKSLAALRGKPVHLRVFVGSQQAKVPFELAQHPDAQFHILSKDRDYDVLIKHLNATGVKCQRSASLDDIPTLKAHAPQKSAPPEPAPRAGTDPLADVIAYLRNLKNSRPRKLKTLASTLKARFVRSGAEREVQALVEALQQRGVVQVSGTNVTYLLDA